jgi:hypothetical protein
VVVRIGAGVVQIGRDAVDCRGTVQKFVDGPAIEKHRAGRANHAQPLRRMDPLWLASWNIGHHRYYRSKRARIVRVFERGRPFGFSPQNVPGPDKYFTRTNGLRR